MNKSCKDFEFSHQLPCAWIAAGTLISALVFAQVSLENGTTHSPLRQTSQKEGEPTQ